MSSVRTEAGADVLTTTVSKTPLGDVDVALADHFGLDALEVSRLGSERDEIFLIDAASARRFVLRLSNPAEDPEVLDMQTQALRWIERVDPALPVPRLLPDRQGRFDTLVRVGANPPRRARLSTYLRGLPLPVAERSSDQRRALGATLAQLDLALRDFDHAGAGHELAWDVKSASRLAELVPAGEVDTRRWDLVRSGLERFETGVKKRLPELRSQVVHGDFNPHNILVDPRDPRVVSGILDFGDMVRTPLVADLAIACCYHTQEVDPLSCIGEIVVGYHRLLPLQPLEVEMLFDLIITRLCAAVTITEWRARRYPENSSYILKNTGNAWNGLHRLAGIEAGRAAQLLREVCNIR